MSTADEHARTIAEAREGPFLVSLRYRDVDRVVEPYSFRSRGHREGALMCYQLKPKEKGHIQSLLLSVIEHPEVLERAFVPREGWEIDLDLGEPDLAEPEDIWDVLIDAMEAAKKKGKKKPSSMYVAFEAALEPYFGPNIDVVVDRLREDKEGLLTEVVERAERRAQEAAAEPEVTFECSECGADGITVEHEECPSCGVSFEDDDDVVEGEGEEYIDDTEKTPEGDAPYECSECKGPVYEDDEECRSCGIVFEDEEGDE